MVEESTMKACIEMKSLASLLLLLQWTGSSVSMGKMAEYTTPSEALRWGMTAGWDAPRAVLNLHKEGQWASRQSWHMGMGQNPGT